MDRHIIFSHRFWRELYVGKFTCWIYFIFVCVSIQLARIGSCANEVLERDSIMLFFLLFFECLWMRVAGSLVREV